MRRTLLLALLLAVSICSKAQTSHVYFDRLDIKKGLPESYIRAMTEDSEGYMWIATQNGLVRYDGYNYKVYNLGSDKVNLSPVTNVLSIVAGEDKSLWVSVVGNGIFRYDRTKDSFEQFAYPAKRFFQYLGIRVVDKRGDLWGLINQDQTIKIVRFDVRSKRYEFFSNTDKGNNYINSPDLYPPVRLLDGNILIGTDNGMYLYNGAGKPLTAFLAGTDTAKSIGVNPVYQAPSQPGLLWANLFHGHNIGLRVACIDIKTGKIIKEYHASKNLDSIFDAGVNTIYEDKKQRLWFACTRGLSKLDRQTGKFTNYLTADTAVTDLSRIVEDKNGKLWISPLDNLLYFDPDNGHYEYYRGKPGEPGAIVSGDITVKLVDRANTLWLSYGYGGANKLSRLKSAFEVIKTGESKVNNYQGGAAHIISSLPNRTRIANSTGIYNWPAGTTQFNKIYSVEPGQKIRGVVEDDNVLYVATSNGFVVYNLSTGGKNTYRNNPNDEGSIPSSSIAAVMKDHTGSIWVGLFDKGICSFDPVRKKFTRYPFHTNVDQIFNKNDGALDDAHVITIYEDMQNTLWVGTNAGGLNKFDEKTGKFFSYFNKQNQKLNCISDIFEDRSGRFWVGTYLTGAFEFDRKKGTYTRHLTENNGLLYNGIIGIKEDSVGRIWIATDRGLSRLNPKTGAIRNYKADDILPGVELAWLQRNSLADGRFVMGTNNGMALFNPTALDDDEYAPVVHIESIRYNTPGANDSLAKQSLRYGITRLELSHSQNSVQFNYIALHYENPAGNTYAYMLEGYDKQWVQAGTNRTVTYNNLPAGTYTFKVKAANSSGVWEEKGDSIVVVISPPWWFTWWAWILWALVFIAAIYYYVKYRSQQLIYQNQLLEEKVEQRTDELQVANKELSEQQLEITSQRDKLSDTVSELKAAQQQLIQSEKLASLGELTAGIAHEIQNPLNFVNNFSEVSIELAVEMKQELRSGSKKEALSLADDIVLNLEKIVLHGKRADGIVKNMLQHSRTNTGEKHITDMNALVDEYLRLSYHGLRAKNKNFNADMVLDLDPDLPKITVIPQDLGRVMLNLFNNAFYAVQLKKKTAGKKYKPLVEVSTSLFTPPKGKSEIRIYVKDNGNGIPEVNKDKIMQPFFTTKPTGEGTGLGLSLSYDIVVKGHSGKMDMSSKEGEYTEFTIHLPVS
jgi:ligand-binding sensor domain-containing protein/signal transduction histidine kinase